MTPADFDNMNPLPAQLAAPLIAEQLLTLHGEQLQRDLLPLVVFVHKYGQRTDLTPWMAEHYEQMRVALAAVAGYGQHADELLNRYREALTAAHAQLAQRVLPLELALLQSGPDWRGIVFRLLHRLYQHNPTLALACQREAVQPRAPLNWEAIAFRLLDRLQQYEPELAREPSDLVKRVRAHLDSPSMKARAALPIEHRRALAGITSHSLTPTPQND
jgi:hypothetical protein